MGGAYPSPPPDNLVPGWSWPTPHITVSPQVLPALVGAILGVPAGLALFSMTGDDLVIPTSGQLLAVVVGTALVVAGLTMVPARLGARRPAAEILQAEHA